MAAPPNDGYGQYPQQQYGQEAQYSDQPPQAYDGQATPPPQPGAAYAAPEHGKKKKRGYATEAYGFGSGANAGATPGPPGAGPPVPGASPALGPAQTAAYGGYPGQEFQAGYAAPAQPAPYGAPQPAVGGYQAPDAYYQPGVAQQQPQGVAGITAGMGGLNVGGGPAPAPQGPQQQGRLTLNQLYPTDLMNQPFNVSELDLPPPPCILPPNVSHKVAIQEALCPSRLPADNGNNRPA